MTAYARVALPTGVRTNVETETLASGDEVQVCRASVQRGSGPSREVILLLDVYGRVLPTPADLINLGRILPTGGVLAGLQSTRSGEASVVLLPEFETFAEDVTVAAA